MSGKAKTVAGEVFACLMAFVLMFGSIGVSMWGWLILWGTVDVPSVRVVAFAALLGLAARLAQEAHDFAKKGGLEE